MVKLLLNNPETLLPDFQWDKCYRDVHFTHSNSLRRVTPDIVGLNDKIFIVEVKTHPKDREKEAQVSAEFTLERAARFLHYNDPGMTRKFYSIYSPMGNRDNVTVTRYVFPGTDREIRARGYYDGSF